VPDQTAINLWETWKKTLPTLIDDLLVYYSSAFGKPVVAVSEKVQDCCPKFGCLKRTSSKVGLFPTSPSQARTAISIECLNFYSALFERSCDAVTAMAAAMNSFYSRRGFRMVNIKGDETREPFRRGLGYAAEWLETLHLAIDDRMEQAVAKADMKLINLSSLSPSAQTSASTNFTNQCSLMLRQLCPACFGMTEFGKSMEEGCDIHVSTDGCFHHRHLVSGGEGLPVSALKQILPKAFVDEIGAHIQTVRKSAPKQRKPKVPDAAIDECQSSYIAAEGDKKRSALNGSRYDAQGWMALTCRHDVPLMLANIDTPGEQQKYSIALIMWLFSQLPSTATVTLLYDIACVLERSIELYDILSVDIASRIQFATSAMHAYGHQWACQLANNPRFMKGLGLSDGEGVERTWSKLRKLIPIVRASSLAKRAALTARQLAHIGTEAVISLGDWVAKRHKNGVLERRGKAQDQLRKCGVPIEELRRQWALQKDTQMTIPSHSPRRLKKQLDTVVSLQTEMEKVEEAIQTAQSISLDPPILAIIMGKLSDARAELTKSAGLLYSSMNMHDYFPDLDGLDHEFIKLLFLAQDLKTNVRHRAIASFFEWDRLNQAVSGKNQTLGTKLYQQTQNSIKKRQPALVQAIRQYNQYCLQLEASYRPTYRIPLPAALPTKIAQLKGESDLMEDVWITPPHVDPPQWLDNSNVKAGIQAVRSIDRSEEEEIRLGFEVSNMCQSHGRELAAVDVALLQNENSSINLQLLQYRDGLISRKDRWAKALGQTHQFLTKIQEATKIAERTLQQYQSIQHGSLLKPPPPSLNRQIMEISMTFGGDSVNSDLMGDDVDLVEDLLLMDILSEDLDEPNVDNVTLSQQHYSVITSPNIRTLPQVTCQNDFDIKFMEGDFKRVTSKLAVLNSTCIDNLAKLLQRLNSKDPAYRVFSLTSAIFSTQHIVQTRYNTSDLELWQALEPLKYWTKPIWIIPIYQPRRGQWVLAVVYIRSAQIFLYD
ncbi:hypothetical protein CPB83DRAFT_742460, partial [Crepidotus variabilis]